MNSHIYQATIKNCRNANVTNCDYYDTTPCTGAIPGQCILQARYGNGLYNCVDRSDETFPTRHSDTTALDNQTIILTQCTAKYGNNGIECNGVCKPVGEWCQTEYNSPCPDLGPGVTMNLSLIHI